MVIGHLRARLCCTRQTIDQLGRRFAAPPNDARPMVRWWWFGPAVTKDEITREIHQMHEGGLGGFELTSVYPLALDDPQKGIRNLRYGSPEMVEMLHFAQQQGRALGMRVDLTPGQRLALRRSAYSCRSVRGPLEDRGRGTSGRDTAEARGWRFTRLRHSSRRVRPNTTTPRRRSRSSFRRQVRFPQRPRPGPR